MRFFLVIWGKKCCYHWGWAAGVEGDDNEWWPQWIGFHCPSSWGSWGRGMRWEPSRWVYLPHWTNLNYIGFTWPKCLDFPFFNAAAKLRHFLLFPFFHAFISRLLLNLTTDSVRIFFVGIKFMLGMKLIMGDSIPSAGIIFRMFGGGCYSGETYGY